MNIHPITKDIIFEILSEMVESGDIQLGWNGDIKEFELDVVNFNPKGHSTVDYFCTLLYFESGRTLSKSVVLGRDQVMYRIRDKKLDNLGI